MLLASLVKKDIVFKALACLIVARNLLYNCIKWPELCSLLIIYNPAINPILINSHTTIPFIIKQSYKERKAEVKAEMRDSEHQIHLSIDGWSAPNRRKYLAVCSHFVNRDGDLKKYTIGLKEMAAGTGGDEQAAVLIQVIQDFEITDKLGYIVGDNHTSNDKLCRKLEEHFISEGRTDWKASQRRIRCQGHVINLIVQAFLFCKSKQAIDDAITSVAETNSFKNNIKDLLVTNID
jgi:hypothetical protein